MIKKTAVFLVQYDSNWIGGLYYKRHLVSALRASKPQMDIVLFTENINKKYVNDIFKDLNVIVKTYNVTSGFKNYIFSKLICRIKLFLYLVSNIKYLFFCKVFDYKKIGILRFVPHRNRIFWIPDIQDLFFPELFPNQTLLKKKLRYDFISKNAEYIIFSSYDSFNKFISFYPILNQRKIKIVILRFAVFNIIKFDLDFSYFTKKYNLYKKKYFIVSNQFMAHKNHFLVLESLVIIKSFLDKLNIKIVFTGNTVDPRNPKYFDLIKNIIHINNLDNNVIITGLIDRNEQLTLLKNSIAVIQPSLFEGWNSTIEDCKSMNLNIICSNIEVHFEQLINYPAIYFEKSSSKELAQVLLDVISNPLKFLKSNFPIYSDTQFQFEKEVVNLFYN